MKRLRHIVCTLACCALPTLGAAGPSTMSLSGQDWRIQEDADGQGAERGLPTADPAGDGWIPATVPGNIQSDLEAAHHLTPHWYGVGDERMFDVARKDWWYRKDVRIPASFEGRRLTLVFDGVDFECEVWLNGTRVGGNAGMFRRFTVDVTEAAKPGQDNQLAVRIARIPEALNASARFRITGPGGKRVVATVEAPLAVGRNHVNAELELEHPDLWWPVGHGGQPLYTVQTDLETVDGGETLDTRTTRFGVREVKWVHTEGVSTNYITRYQLILNGRPIRTIGSNLIPPDLLFGRMGPKALDRIRRARDIGANILRLWGGGVILHEEAYDLADELGMMLILEVPLANQWPDTNEVYLANLDVTARNIFKQIRNHPSIVEFGGGNEMPWQSDTIHPALQILQKAAAEESDRIFRASCPDHGGSHGTWFFDLNADCGDYDKRSTMRAGEYGTASPANLENWHRTLPPASQWPVVGPREPVQARKNIVRGAFNDTYWLAQNKVEEVFGPIDTLPMMIEAGQFYGAEGLRYATDALRRKGPRISGMMTWDFNEPWPNGAGSFLIDYNGRTLMNYDFFKQAIAPVALSLKYNSVFYDLVTGIDAELFITSDAPESFADLQWSWLARDRRGRVLDRGEGAASIDPIESKYLGFIRVKPLTETGLGPLFLELRLEDSSGRLLTERIHVFAADGVRGVFAGLLRNRGADTDDGEAVKSLTPTPLQREPANLAYVGNGAAPATASSSRAEAIHQPAGINDGRYGNDHSWIGLTPQSTFQIDLGKASLIGQFRTGRDRNPHGFRGRGLDTLKIETSPDGESWQLAFEQAGLAALPGFSPEKTLTMEVAPVEARFVRGTVKPVNAGSDIMPCLDEFEVYAPSSEPPGSLAWVNSEEEGPELWRPVTRTQLAVTAAPMRVEEGREVLALITSDRPR